MPKISVIITAHNYGRYLGQAVNSVLTQTCDDWELVIVDDGSTDNTSEILAAYSENPKIQILHLDGVGLAKAANSGIRASGGKYVIRLDADDYFDENILLVLSNILDRNPELGMIYPDYYRVSKYGEILDYVRQPKVNDEVYLLDRSALAAGAMYRRECFEALDGYNENLTRQEDYDYWIRFIDNYHVYNVQLPLMYYRQHGKSMSTANEKRMAARRQVKKRIAKEARDLANKNVLCVLPVVTENRFRHGLPLTPLNGRPMLSYVLEEAIKVPLFDRIIVNTEDHEIAEVAKSLGAEVPFLRPRKLAKLHVQTADVLRHMLKKLYEQDGYEPDIIVIAYYNFPFISAAHLEEAVHSLVIHNCDSVISVGRDIKFHWQPGPHGLTPVLYPRELLNDQKWTTYEERGGIFALDARNVMADDFLGSSTSFIEVGESEGFRIDSDFNFWVAEQILKQGYQPMADSRKLEEGEVLRLASQ